MAKSSIMVAEADRAAFSRKADESESPSLRLLQRLWKELGDSMLLLSKSIPRAPLSLLDSDDGAMADLERTREKEAMSLRKAQKDRIGELYMVSDNLRKERDTLRKRLAELEESLRNDRELEEDRMK